MNIYTVRDNLKNTIAGKEQYLAGIHTELRFVGLRDGEAIALRATAERCSGVIGGSGACGANGSNSGAGRAVASQPPDGGNGCGGSGLA